VFIQKPHQYQLIKGDLIMIESFTCSLAQTIRLNLSASNLPLYEGIYEFDHSKPTSQLHHTQSFHMGDLYGARASAYGGSDAVMNHIQQMKSSSDQISIWKLYKEFITIKQANHHHQN
jgi:hypothetical protein